MRNLFHHSHKYPVRTADGSKLLQNVHDITPLLVVPETDPIPVSQLLKDAPASAAAQTGKDRSWLLPEKHIDITTKILLIVRCKLIRLKSFG